MWVEVNRNEFAGSGVDRNDSQQKKTDLGYKILKRSIDVESRLSNMHRMREVS